MRLLHTSDWHIGRQFHHYSLLEDQREVLAQIISITAIEKIEVVIIAGDLYDRAVPAANAVKLVDQVLFRLCHELKVTVIIIAGNHDGPERLSFAARQLVQSGLHIIGPLQAVISPIRLFDDHGEIVFYPIPYADPATVRNVYGVIKGETGESLHSHDQCMAKILAQIPAHKTQRSVAISHCFLRGGVESESERPISVGGSEQVSYKHFEHFNYAAIGHLHQAQSRGYETIRYSGSPLKYSFSEASHQKSVTLINIDGAGKSLIKTKKLKALHDVRTLSGSLADIIAQGKQDPQAKDYIMVRLSDKQAILDPMGKLRAVYENILHLERPGLMANNRVLEATRDGSKKSELSMFKDFYQQVQNQSLNKDQAQILIQLLDDLQTNREL